MNNEILTFKLTNDNRPLREQSLEGSILSEQYKYALRQINEYLGELDLENISKPDHEESSSHERQNQRSETIGSDIDYNNNIFAFIGDRGSGKTSCMITVADFLIRQKEVLKAEEYPKIDKVNFVTIDLIDPAYFDSGHNLISLFLAKLYKSFCEVKSKYERDVRHHYDKGELSENTRNQFLYQFRRTQENLYHVMGIIKYDNNQDLLEFVDGLSASVNLKDNIKELIDLYLEYIGMKDAVLILRIDDVDLNEKHAGQMVEAMRKYFIQPNILVLLSLKLKQLEDVKYLELKEFYDKHDKGVFTRDELYEMVYKYMVKLIPRSHRIFMPKYDNYHGKKLLVEYYHLSDKDRGVKKEAKSLEFASVRQAVPQLIFWKTRYLFYNYIAHESYIVPENLRELRQLIKLMVTLPYYRETDFQGKVLHTNWNNKTIFKNYFFDTWLSNNLPASHREDAQRIVNEGTDININALVLNILKNRYDDTKEKEKGLKHNYIESSPNFGEVLSYIHDTEKKVSLPEDRKLLFFIKSLYSIKLYEAYDILTEDENLRSEGNEEEIFIDGNSKTKPLAYKLLTGGPLFLAEKEISSMVYEVDKSKLEELIKNIIDLKNELNLGSVDHDAKLKQLELRCQWIELLMLCTDIDKMKFDVGNLFYYLPFMMSGDQSRYSKLEGGSALFAIIKDKARGFKTLGDEFIQSTIEHRLHNDDSLYNEHRWQSFCTIRNIEVLEGFLTRVKNGAYSGTDTFLNFSVFFEKAAEFKVTSYDREEIKPKEDEKTKDEASTKEENKTIEPYSIDFKFFEKVSNLITKSKEDGNENILSDISKVLKAIKVVAETASGDRDEQEPQNEIIPLEQGVEEIEKSTETPTEHKEATDK